MKPDTMNRLILLGLWLFAVGLIVAYGILFRPGGPLEDAPAEAHLLWLLFVGAINGVVLYASIPDKRLPRSRQDMAVPGERVHHDSPPRSTTTHPARSRETGSRRAGAVPLHGHRDGA